MVRSPVRPPTLRAAVRTYTPRPTDVDRRWHVIDAHGAVLGRVATETARLLMGKHKVTWAPHVDGGDHVIIVNAAQLDVSPRKAGEKRYHRHSGYPGGLRTLTLADLLARHPERVLRLAVRGMLPKNRLGRKMLRRLRVYAGPEHPHAAQRPVAHPVARSGARDVARPADRQEPAA